MEPPEIESSDIVEVSGRTYYEGRMVGRMCRAAFALGLMVGGLTAAVIRKFVAGE